MSERLNAMAIEELSRTQFETFAQFVLQELFGINFVPTGGIHDGGLDGYFRNENTSSHFMQASKEEGTSSKIRKTIRRIKQTREITKLTYVTSKIVSDRDVLESKIRKDTGVEVQILSNSWLCLQSDLYSNIQEHLFTASREFVDKVRMIQNAQPKRNDAERLSIVSYMELQASSLPEVEDFHVLCLDSLIYESLKDTDPSTNEFLIEDDIRRYIVDAYPQALEKVGVSLSERLDFLSSKQNSPRIRRHAGVGYALPYDVRNLLSESNLAISAAEDNFISSVNRRVQEHSEDFPDELRPYLASAINWVVVETYRRQAMNFIASFNLREADNSIPVFEIIDEYFSEQELDEPEKDLCKDMTALLVRHVFYSSSEDERAYIVVLMKYFTVHFLMEGDKAVTRYFSDMAQRLKLYVGTDIMVRMLSEILVKKPSRAMTNTVALLKRAGVKLYVTRQVLEEVYHHVCSANSEFVNDHNGWFRHVQISEAKNFDRILIRSFYYAFLEPENHERQPKDWHSYLANFGNAAWFDSGAKRQDDFGTFLVNKFGLEFVESDVIRRDLDRYVLNKLTEKIIEIREANPSKTTTLLAKNDAEMMMYVNRARIENNERVGDDIYGMDTWWLTEETAVVRAARAVQTADDSVMNPQFLLNHYFIDPNSLRERIDAAEVAMPTTFGLRITDRVPKERMDSFVQEIGDISKLDEAAIKARIRSAANHLKQRQR